MLRRLMCWWSGHRWHMAPPDANIPRWHATHCLRCLVPTPLDWTRLSTALGAPPEVSDGR